MMRLAGLNLCNLSACLTEPAVSSAATPVQDLFSSRGGGVSPDVTDLNHRRAESLAEKMPRSFLMDGR